MFCSALVFNFEVALDPEERAGVSIAGFAAARRAHDTANNSHH